jgi:hypothetical protein
MNFKNVLYAICSALFVGGTTLHSQAEIIYSGANRNVVYTTDSQPDPETFSLFDATENWDDVRMMLVWSDDNDPLNGYYRAYQFSCLAPINGHQALFAVGIDDSAKRFDAGEIIDGTSLFDGNQELSHFEYFAGQVLEYGEFRNTTGYVGLRMTDGQNVYYGWMRVSVTNYDNAQFAGTLIDWAYENTPGLGIAAGAGLPNNPPVANAGLGQAIRVGDIVQLDGSESFDDNTAQTALSYAWSFDSRPNTSLATLDNASLVNPSFVADVAGTYALSLVVTDGDGLESDPVFVEISSDNLAPTAVATADFSLVIVGDVIQFDGSDSSDPEEDELTYNWSIVSAPATSTAELFGDDTAFPILTPDVEGAYVVRLEASDFLGPGAPAEIVITATLAVEFAEIVILEASDIVTALVNDQVTNKGNQKGFQKTLDRAIKEIQKGHFDHAIKALNDAIERTDGCALRGSPDGNGKGRDWITDCDAQLVIYDLLTLAVDALEN